MIFLFDVCCHFKRPLSFRSRLSSGEKSYYPIQIYSLDFSSLVPRSVEMTIAAFCLIPHPTFHYPHTARRTFHPYFLRRRDAASCHFIHAFHFPYRRTNCASILFVLSTETFYQNVSTYVLLGALSTLSLSTFHYIRLLQQIIQFLRTHIRMLCQNLLHHYVIFYVVPLFDIGSFFVTVILSELI